MYTGSIQFLRHESQVLRSNPLGDPSRRSIPVYLPPDYEKDDKRYPVIWVLAPFSSWGERFLNVQAWEENLPQRMDRLIAEEKAAPAIVVFPNCFTRYGGSQYLNSSAVGRYEDYVTRELVPFIDGNLRTIPDHRYRGLVGHSSGGYGAWVLSMRHPDLFGGFAGHSGDALFEYCYWPDIPGFVRLMSIYKGDVRQFITQFETLPDKGKDWGNALNIIAMSACYSPNRSSSLGFDLLCDPTTGEIDETIWHRWMKHDPVRMVTRFLDSLRKMSLIYFDCGIRDEHGLFLGARKLHALLEDASIPHIYIEHNGGHQQLGWRYDSSLALLTKRLSPV